MNINDFHSQILDTSTKEDIIRLAEQCISQHTLESTEYIATIARKNQQIQLLDNINKQQVDTIESTIKAVSERATKTAETKSMIAMSQAIFTFMSFSPTACMQSLLDTSMQNFNYPDATKPIDLIFGLKGRLVIAFKLIFNIGKPIDDIIEIFQNQVAEELDKIKENNNESKSIG